MVAKRRVAGTEAGNVWAVTDFWWALPCGGAEGHTVNNLQ